MRCLQPPVSGCISHVWRAIYLPRAVLQQPVVAFPDKRDSGAVGEERRGGAGEKVRAEGGGRGHSAVVRLRLLSCCRLTPNFLIRAVTAAGCTTTLQLHVQTFGA